MPLSLFKVDRVVEWPTQKPGVTLFLVKGITVEDTPVSMTLKTVKPLQASLCQRSSLTGQYVWAGWRQARNYGEGDLITCELDTTTFQHEAEAS